MAIRFLQTVDSTNNEAKRMISSGEAEEGLCILARTQTGGRGTQGRHWVSPPDAGLYFSLIHFPHCLVPDENVWTMAAGVACCQALTELYPDLPVQIKPINDLYVGGKKLGGILTEAVIHQGKIHSMVTGIGINLYEVPREITDSTIEPTSLSSWIASEQGQVIDGKSMALKIQEELSAIYQCIQRQDVSGVKTAYEQWVIAE